GWSRTRSRCDCSTANSATARPSASTRRTATSCSCALPPASRPPRRRMPNDYFGEEVAARYDETSDDMFEPGVVNATVDFLAELAGDGAALELGIGTGRVALPLAARGVAVHGIDLSEAMVARLRKKPGGERIP